MEKVAEKKKGRMIEQDAAKGLAMLAVIVTHSTTLFSAGGRDLQLSSLFSIIMVSIFGYAMPFYVVMAGYNYRPKDVSYWETIKIRSKQLLSSFFKFTLALWIILGAYMVVRGETTVMPLVKSFIAFWITDPLAGKLGLDASRTLVAQALGPTWFVKYLFVASLIFYAVAPYAVKDNKRMASVIFGLASITVLLLFFNIELPWGIEVAPAVASFMLLGTLMKKMNVLTGEESSWKWRLANLLASIGMSIALQISANRVGMFSGGRVNMVLGPLETYLTVICGFVGTYIMITLGRYITKIPVVGRFFIWFGKNSLLFLFVHGSIMRVISDCMGLTGKPGSDAIGLNNIIMVALTIFFTSMFILAREAVLKKTSK